MINEGGNKNRQHFLGGGHQKMTLGDMGEGGVKNLQKEVT